MRSRLRSLNRQHDVTFRCCRLCVPAWHVFPLRDSNICLCHKHWGHLAASSELRRRRRLDFDIEIQLNSSERSCPASPLALCAGMINVTNHLLTPRGQDFGLWPITLLHPAVFSQPLFSVEGLHSPHPPNTSHLNTTQSVHELNFIQGCS